jgi:hypothetical protein
MRIEIAMNLRQIVLITCLTANLALGVSLTGCTIATPPAPSANPSTVTPVATNNASTVNPSEPTAMPLPTLPENRRPRAVETPITITITETRVPAKDAQRIALVFQWHGGIAGRNDMWTIYQSGLVRSNKGIDQNVGSEVVQKLLADIEALGYFDLNEQYRANCADCFEYSILAYKGDNKKAVRAMDDGSLPESLMKVVAAIREVVAPTI